MKHIEEQLKLLPDSPGVYLMKDEFDDIIYVGKAKSLRNRVRSYFGRGIIPIRQRYWFPISGILII